MRIHTYIKSTQVLGPYKRFSLWLQGCGFNCDNCMTPDAQPFDGGYDIDEKELSKIIQDTKDIEGITITGGEPFLQAKQINQMLDMIDMDLGIIVYTGYTIMQLISKEDSEVNSLLNRIDILIDGLYIDKLNDNSVLRGSSNQNIYQLTKRYSDVFDRYYNNKKREIEIYLEKEEIMIVGVPSKTTIEKLNKVIDNNI